MSEDSILEQQQEVDEAHGSAHFFRGKRLEKFSFDHQMAYQRICMRGVAPVEAATVLVFLCTLGDAALPGEPLTGWDLIDMARDPVGIRAFRKRMSKWATENEVGLEGASSQQCIDIATKIWEEIDVSKFKADPKKGEKSTEGNALARPSGPNTSTRSRKSPKVRSRPTKSRRK